MDWSVSLSLFSLLHDCCWEDSFRLERERERERERQLN